MKMKHLYFLSSFLVLVLFLNKAASVPTSVLAKNSELSKVDNNLNASSIKLVTNEKINTKVKRSFNNDVENTVANTATPLNWILNKKSSPEVVPADYNAPARASSTSSMQEQELQQQLQEQRDRQQAVEQLESAASLEEAGLSRHANEPQNYFDDNNNDAASMQKRGINTPTYLYDNEGTSLLRGDGYDSFSANNNAYEVDMMPDNENVLYDDAEDIPTSQVPSYRMQAYDNLQNMLNSEAYSEALPVHISTANMPTQYYGSVEAIARERNKRRNQYYNNKFANDRLKRNSKFTPADMLALVALVEAGERARKDSEDEMPLKESYTPHNFYNYYPYDYAAPMDETNYKVSASNDAWVEPMTFTDYYGVPMNVDPSGKYANRGHKYIADYDNRGNNNRFMVSKKKRFTLEPRNYGNYAGKKYF